MNEIGAALVLALFVCFGVVMGTVIGVNRMTCTVAELSEVQEAAAQCALAGLDEETECVRKAWMKICEVD